MKTKHVLLVIVLSVITCLTGCYWLVPGSIKRQTNLVNLDVKTARKEIADIEKNQTMTEEQKLQAIKEKAIIVLDRLKPQVQNVDDYTHGRPASPIEENK